MMVADTPSNGHAPTYQISSTNIERQRSNGLDNIRQLFYLYLTLEVRGQGQMNVMMVYDTSSNGHAPTYQISLTWNLERQKGYDPYNILQLFDLGVKGQGQMIVIMVHDTLPYGHTPTYQILLTYLERQKSYGSDNRHPLFYLI